MPADPLTRDEERELSRLFSALTADIHNLSGADTQLLIGVDEHLRGDSLTKADLESLRALDKRRGHR